MSGFIIVFEKVIWQFEEWGLKDKHKFLGDFIFLA
jgi:hypothetical protein